ncbi:hypothetical protein ACR6C2_26005 [Streptomyces sp. INA 01156]
MEIAVVDESRGVRLVTARADDTGDLGELFWAHTGGGGGNFGVVTAYEFRSPEHLATEPVGLPRASAGCTSRRSCSPGPRWTRRPSSP